MIFYGQKVFFPVYANKGTGQYEDQNHIEKEMLAWWHCMKKRIKNLRRAKSSQLLSWLDTQLPLENYSKEGGKIEAGSFATTSLYTYKKTLLLNVRTRQSSSGDAPVPGKMAKKILCRRNDTSNFLSRFRDPWSVSIWKCVFGCELEILSVLRIELQVLWMA